MKSAIISDIHGNLPALEKVIKNTKFVDRYIVLGDVVNYGPWSNECVELIDSLENCIKILGNHDLYFLNKKINSHNSLVKKFFEHSYKNFNKSEYLKKYEKEYMENNTLFTHSYGEQYIYEDTKIEIETNLIVGHSHKQYYYKKDNLFVANPGSVGQNRKYINKIDYILHESKNNDIELKYLLYEINILTKEMKIKKYSEECINYYLNKNYYD